MTIGHMRLLLLCLFSMLWLARAQGPDSGNPGQQQQDPSIQPISTDGYPSYYANTSNGSNSSSCFDAFDEGEMPKPNEQFLDCKTEKDNCDNLETRVGCAKTCNACAAPTASPTYEIPAAHRPRGYHHKCGYLCAANELCVNKICVSSPPMARRQASHLVPLPLNSSNGTKNVSVASNSTVTTVETLNVEVANALDATRVEDISEADLQTANLGIMM